MRALLLSIALYGATPLAWSAPPAVVDGKAAFVEKCAMCHRDGGMGTGLLSRRLPNPKLEDRTDLVRAYIVHAARVGIGNMPPISKAEVSERELDAIASYLSRAPGSRHTP